MPRFHVILENRAHRTMRAKRKQQQLGQGRLRLPFVCFLTSFVLVASVFLYSNLVLLDVNPLLLQGSSLRSLTVNETHSSSILSQRDTYSQEDDVMDNDKIHIVFSTGCNAYQDCMFLFCYFHFALLSALSFYNLSSNTSFLWNHFSNIRAILCGISSDMESATTRSCDPHRFRLC